MIRAKITYACSHCQSENIVKNGHDPKGKQQYRCKNCGRGGVLNPTVPYTAAEKERIINAYYERPSMRGIERVFGVTRPTLADWLKKSRGRSNHPRDARPRATHGHLGTG
jgi:transposase-like protein